MRETEREISFYLHKNIFPLEFHQRFVESLLTFCIYNISITYFYQYSF